jgi:leucyl/phenylalanyl-tRNA--protein transferase
MQPTERKPEPRQTPPRRSHAFVDLIAKAPYPIRQSILGAGYLLVPRRLPGLLPLIGITLRDLPQTSHALFPDPEKALDNPDGLCGLAGRIDVADLLIGYRRGMFPMSHIGPLKWWAPKYRMVLFFDQARVEKTTRRLLRSKRFQITLDRAFPEVMRACANPRTGGTPLTWITPRIRSLFERAHAEGHAHSVEVWENDTLVGGAYGLAVGGVFFTESQFHIARDASKVGFTVLNRHLQAWGFVLNDGKHPTRYLADCGMKPITREEFSALTALHGAAPGRVGPWTIDPDLLDDRWEPAQAPGVRMEEVLPGGSKCPLSVDEMLTTKRSPTW